MDITISFKDDTDKRVKGLKWKEAVPTYSVAAEMCEAFAEKLRRQDPQSQLGAFATEMEKVKIGEGIDR